MKKITLLLFLFCFSVLFAQKEVSGKVSDSSGAGLSGVNVKEKGTTTGTSTDFDGNYKIKVSENAVLVFSSVGFDKVEKNASEGAVINVTLTDDGGSKLDDVVVVGTRTAPRSNTTSALPVDVLTAKDLNSTGQATFDKALQYKIPSFNTVQTPVNDATSLLDPYEIRNMGPSRTLVLINGKRKNMSSLVYVQTSPGRGETGADISAIPTDAIERVEILRDGASAQYGSDAIAGVMNIILKKNSGIGSTTLRTGITGKGDGEMFGIALNNGSTVGEKGFVNYTVDFSKVNLANRPGTVDAKGEFDTFVKVDPTSYKSYVNKDKTLGGTSIVGLDDDQRNAIFLTYQGSADYTAKLATINNGNAVGLKQINDFLNEKPDAGNVNGSPETASAKFLVNGGVNYSDNTQFYYNAAYVYKKVSSFANYRTPYWRNPVNLFENSAIPNWGIGEKDDKKYLYDLFGNGSAASYKGYVPNFIGDLNDYNATIGYKSKMNDWNTDVSLTTGGNSQNYVVSNSQNRSDILNGTSYVYRGNSPITFRPGGTSFTHYVGNIDISKVIDKQLSIGFGSEFRTETFEIIAGDKASYEGSGADSFQGNAPENSGKFNRYNIGAYLDVAYDATKDFLINGTARYENYSDFGSATVWKLSSRYKLLDDKLTFRGSVSTGFRAPSLHQIYTEKSQSTFSGGQIAVTGIVNNVSASARLNGIPSLTAEKSTNITFGFGFKPVKNFSLTLDYYNIKVKDRIVLGNLVDFGAGEQAFFVNAIDSKTSGLDFVSSYRNIGLGTGKLSCSLAGNYTFENGIDGDVKNPASVKALGKTVFNLTQDALMFTSRPKFKYILGFDYEIGQWGLSLNNTMFGPTIFKNADFANDNLRVKFETKTVTDLGINYSPSKKITLTFNVNNLLDVIPKFNIVSDKSGKGQVDIDNPATLRDITNALTFDGRYSTMTYDGYHFSQLGRMFNLTMNYKF